MTVIAAIPTNDGVIMASDTRLMRRGVIVGTTEKITVKWAGPEHGQCALLAIAGSHALAESARHELDLPTFKAAPTPEKADAWAHGVAMRLTRLAARAEPPLTVDEGEVDGEALLAYGPHLWLLSGQSATRLTAAFAIGSGADAARGALHAIDSLFGSRNDAADTVARAVVAACAIDSNCGGEIQIARTTINAVTSSDGVGDPLPG